MSAMEKTVYDLRVLFVEDNEQTRRAGSRMIQRHVQTLYTAENGVQGLELYRREKPDLVISDIEMPEMDGLEMFRQIRRQDPHLPLVICTAYNFQEYREQAREIDVDQYLLKPFGKENILQVLEHTRGIIDHFAALRNRYAQQGPAAIPA